MELVHRALAYAAVTAVGVGIAWSLVLAMRPEIGPRNLDRFGVGVTVVFLVGAIVGLAQLASGARPSEDLHLLYAAIAIGLIPLARSFVPTSSRHGGWMRIAAYLVLGAVLFRLFTTG